MDNTRKKRSRPSQQKAGPVSVLTELEALISAVDPTTVGPPQLYYPQPGDTVIVAACDDYLRQVHGVHSSLVEEFNALAAEGNKIMEALFGKASSLSGAQPARRSELLEDLFIGNVDERRQQVERMKEIENILPSKMRMVQLTETLFKVELHRRHPAVLEHPGVIVRYDWAIVVASANAMMTIVYGRSRHDFRDLDDIDGYPDSFGDEFDIGGGMRAGSRPGNGHDMEDPLLMLARGFGAPGHRQPGPPTRGFARIPPR